MSDPGKLAVKEAPRPKPKRFYKSAAVAQEGPAYRVLLDGKPVRTPLGHFLETPLRTLADAVAAEWDAPSTHIDAEAMPLTRLLSTQLDVVAPERAAIIATLLKYTDTDLLCYRAGRPADLAARQHAVWQPVLDWLAASHHITFKTADGIMPIVQPPAAKQTFQSVLGALTDARLTVFQAVAAATGSLALAMALVHGKLSAAEVVAAAHLDENHQMQQWGEDRLAVERLRRIEAEILGAGLFLRLSGG